MTPAAPWSLKAFLARFSKAVGSFGGGTLGALIGAGLQGIHHPVPPSNVWMLPVVGGVISTVLAPANAQAPKKGS
jgi:hypothetical protein